MHDHDGNWCAKEATFDRRTFYSIVRKYYSVFHLIYHLLIISKNVWIEFFVGDQKRFLSRIAGNYFICVIVAAEYFYKLHG